MQFNLRQIEVFRAIMVTGSISGAARMLSVSQPAVSRLLAYTEYKLGLKLFERVKGRVQATPEARRLITEVDQVHQGVIRVNELARQLRERGTGALHIAVSPSLGQSLAPEAVAVFRQLFPEVRIELEILTLMELADRVGGNRVDLGLSILPVDEPTIATSTILQGALQVICRREHPLAALKVIRPQDLEPFPLIGYGPQTPYGMHVERVLGPILANIRVNTIVRFTPVACTMVQAGAGVAIVDDFVTRGKTWPDVVVRPLLPRTSMHVHLLTSRLEPLSRLANAFIDVLKKLPGNPVHNDLSQQISPMT